MGNSCCFQSDCGNAGADAKDRQPNRERDRELDMHFHGLTPSGLKTHEASSRM